ncbi:FAD binding domain-containing protein [Streptomyces sp. NBC_01589]|uniref:FAD binding domain-containing protein n=1 Tax=Streptomyces sp. NBC_01589 TaxID=2975886 RepID=UPI0038675F55
MAVQPSDPAVALACLDAEITTEHVDGGRRIPAAEFHTLPGEDPSAHNVLRPGELITGIEIGAPVPKSAYVKVRERQSYEFALVSAAAAVEIQDGLISRARLALGSVAMRPWRLYDAEQALVGLRPGSPAVREAVTSGFSASRPLSSNAYIPVCMRRSESFPGPTSRWTTTPVTGPTTATRSAGSRSPPSSTSTVPAPARPFKSSAGAAS